MAFRQADDKPGLVERKLISPGFHQHRVGQQMVRFLSYDHFCSQSEFFGTQVTTQELMSGVLRCFQIDTKLLRFPLVLWAVFWQKPPWCFCCTFWTPCLKGRSGWQPERFCVALKKNHLASMKMLLEECIDSFPAQKNVGFFFLYSAQLQLKGLCSCFKNMTCIGNRAQESLTF